MLSSKTRIIVILAFYPPIFSTMFNIESKQEFNFHVEKVCRLPLKVYKLENQGCSGFASSTLQEEISTAHGATWIKFHAFINSQLLLINSNILLQAMILKRVGSFVPFWLPQFCTFFHIVGQFH